MLEKVRLDCHERGIIDKDTLVLPLGVVAFQFVDEVGNLLFGDIWDLAHVCACLQILGIHCLRIYCLLSSCCFPDFAICEIEVMGEVILEIVHGLIGASLLFDNWESGCKEFCLTLFYIIIYIRRHFHHEFVKILGSSDALPYMNLYPFSYGEPIFTTRSSHGGSVHKHYDTTTTASV